jgi:addiction module HigA family antidote
MMKKRYGSSVRGARALKNEKVMERRRRLTEFSDPVGKIKKNGMRPVPPGEILNEEFLKPLGLPANALAKAIRVPPNRITAILKEERGITGDTAIRLGTFFKTAAEFWMNLQMTYDLRNAEKALPARVRKSIEENRSALA